MTKVRTVIDILALITNALGKILDRLSSDRRSKATNIPFVEIELHNGHYKDASTGEQAFYLKMTNLDDRRYALDLEIEISIAEPARSRFLSKWFHYVKKQVDKLAPGETRDHILLEEQSSIENFIAKHFPGRILEEIPRNRINPFHYRLIEERRLCVRVTIKYRTSAIDTKPYSFQVYYYIEPINGGPEKWVTNWYIINDVDRH